MLEEVLIDRDRGNGNILSSLVWTDESQFTINGIVTFHNEHLWAEETPTPNEPRRLSGNVWAKVIATIECCWVVFLWQE